MTRVLGFTVALLLIAAGCLGIALGELPDHAAVVAVRGALDSVLPKGALDGLGRSWPRFAMLGAGLLVALISAWPSRPPAPPDFDEDRGPELDPRATRKALKQSAALARKGKLAEAAEICFLSGLPDQAAEYYEAADHLLRAAEIHQQENRLEQAATLYIKIGQYETAGTLYASLDDYEQAAECYRQAGRLSVAAEMFEKSGDHLRAGEAYANSGFHRHAAQAFVRAQQWIRAARCLEEVINEESVSVGTGQSPERQKELRKIVLQAGKLYERAGELDSSERVLEKGGCHAAAAEVALQLQHFAKAAELFLAANDSPRAAEALMELGESQAAARVLGEYHRDRGEDEDAARYLLEAGEHLAAGDLYRKLELMGRAAQCYEEAGDYLQAAETFQLGEEHEHAARNYEAAGHLDEAAQCYGALGDTLRQAKLLERAGHQFRAGQIYYEKEMADEAIKVLQQVGPDCSDFGEASALLGEIFSSKGQHGLAITKLKQAIGTTPLVRENAETYYRLATLHEANAEYREAVEIYEQILAFDYHYSDVGERLENARTLARATTNPDVSGGGPGHSMTAQATRDGRYQIQGELGRGGMGIVYKAQDTVLDRPVAYKVLPDAFKENPQALRNFLREAKSAAKLNHPNIVTVYDAGEQGGVYYIAMEYVDGTTLKEIVRQRGKISPNGVLHVVAQMCEALSYAHEQKVVHRDIKTANTMWTRDKKAKIMDFGLAKVVEEVRNHTTLVSGTPYYMSPEQTLGKNVDHRTDIYSLGVTIFELCSGTLPFREGNVPYHHVHTPPPDVREANPQVPALLAGIINRCLRKNPDERYTTAREIVAELKSGLAKG